MVVNRIGRTGRAMKKGRSLTYMTLDDARFAKKLRVILEESNQPVPGKILLIGQHKTILTSDWLFQMI